MSIPRYTTAPTTAPIQNLGYVTKTGVIRGSMQPSTKQVGQNVLGEIQNQPPPVDLSGYIASQQQLWERAQAQSKAQQAATIAAMNQLTGMYNPNLGLREFRQMMGLYDTTELDAYHRQLMDLYNSMNQGPRQSTTTYMIGYS